MHNSEIFIAKKTYPRLWRCARYKRGHQAKWKCSDCTDLTGPLAIGVCASLKLRSPGLFSLELSAYPRDGALVRAPPKLARLRWFLSFSMDLDEAVREPHNAGPGGGSLTAGSETECKD